MDKKELLKKCLGNSVVMSVLGLSTTIIGVFNRDAFFTILGAITFFVNATEALEHNKQLKEESKNDVK